MVPRGDNSSMSTPEERGRQHLYSSKPRFMRARPGGGIGHPGRHVNIKTWQPSPRSHHWRNMAPSYYFCFVKQAVLWNRGQHHTVILRQNSPPSLCSRFHAHMEACPVRSVHPHFLSMQSRLQPIRLGQKQRQQTLSASQHQAQPDNRRKQFTTSSSTRQFTVHLPHEPATPNPSESSLDPPVSPSPTIQIVDPPNKHIPLGDEDEDAHSSPPELIQGLQEMTKDEAEATTPSTLSTPTTPSVPATPTTLDTPSTPATPTSPVTPNSLSDFSRPASSQFSRSTDLNSSFSDTLSVNFSVHDGLENGSDDEDNRAYDHIQSNNHTNGSSTSLPDPHCNSPGSCGRASSQMKFSQASLFKSHTSCKQGTPSTFLPDTPVHTSKTQSQSSQSSQAPDAQEFTDETLHERPSPSQSGLSPESFNQSRRGHSSAEDSRSGWNLWPVLPPIIVQQDEVQVSGESIIEGTPDSKSSRSQSDIFAELDDLAPRSDSCVSPDHPAGSETDRSSPATDLSPGLAALTVGCDSGDLGSLSRVQLLLLGRRGSESPGSVPSPGWRNTPDGEEYEPGLRVWSSGIPPYYQSTVLENRKPLSGRSSKVHEARDSLVTLKGHGDCPELISEDSGSRTSSLCSLNSRTSESSSRNNERRNQDWEQPEDENDLTYWCSLSPRALLAGGSAREEYSQEHIRPESRNHTDVENHMNMSIRLREKRKRKKNNRRTEWKNKALEIYSKLQDGKDSAQPTHQSTCAKFEDFDFLAKYCIFSQEKLSLYQKAFEAADNDGDGYLSCLQVLVALKEIIPPELLTEEEEIYVYRILELVDFRVTEGLTDLRLFAVVASLAQKIATLDDFMRSLISKMDFKSLEMTLYKAKQLFLFLLEAQTGGAVGCIDGEQLLVELKAGGIRPEHEESVRRELRNLRSLDLLDFLTHLPLFILIHNSVIANPFDDSSNL